MAWAALLGVNTDLLQPPLQFLNFPVYPFIVSLFTAAYNRQSLPPVWLASSDIIKLSGFDTWLCWDLGCIFLAAPTPSWIWDSEHCLLLHGTYQWVLSFLQLSCACSVKCFWLSKHSGRLFQDSASAVVPVVHAGSSEDCIKLHQFTGVPVPWWEAHRLSRADLFTCPPPMAGGWN